MFEKYYNRLRYSQKLADRSLVECIKILESNRNYVFSFMKGKKIIVNKDAIFVVIVLPLLLIH
jgi:hypothetical protein